MLISWAGNRSRPYLQFKGHTCFTSNEMHARLRSWQIIDVKQMKWAMVLTVTNAIFAIAHGSLKNSGLNGVWTRDLAIPVRRSNQLSCEATDVGSWSIVKQMLHSNHTSEPVEMISSAIFLAFSWLHNGHVGSSKQRNDGHVLSPRKVNYILVWSVIFFNLEIKKGITRAQFNTNKWRPF